MVAKATGNELPKGDVAFRRRAVDYESLLALTPGPWEASLNSSEAKLLLKKWMEERRPLLCLGSFNECRLVIEAHVFSVSDDSFTLRSLRSDSTLMFMFGSEGTTFDYAEPREFGIEHLTPELAQLSSVGITFPKRISVHAEDGGSERESLVIIEMVDADARSSARS